MASYNELNALIDAYINRNGVQAITGQILNGVLKAMVEQLGRGYTIMGAATPTTDPGTPDGPECYFASTPGTYTDFDGLQVVPGELALLCYTPSDGWTKATIYEGFQEVEATIDGNVGTPSVGVSYANGVLSFDFHNMKGNPGQNGQDGQDGAAAGFGTIGADITGGVGTPGVSVESSGPATAKNLQFHFTNLKGETGVTSVVASVDNTTGNPACTVSLVGQQLTLAFTGLKGAQGDTGSSVDYPFTIVNNLTTDDATQALSAAQGVVLDGKVTQLEAEVDDNTDEIDTLKETAPLARKTEENGLFICDKDGKVLIRLDVLDTKGGFGTNLVNQIISIVQANAVALSDVMETGFYICNENGQVIIKYENGRWVLYDNKKAGFYRRTGNLANNDVWVLSSNSVKNEKRLVFSGTISSFSSLTLGHGHGTDYASFGLSAAQWNASRVVIDSTKITVYNWNGSETSNEYTHGLTIENEIQVEIVKGHSSTATIRIVSNGNAFSQDVTWQGSQGDIFLKSGSSLTDCSFSWYCNLLKGGTWLFGDSFFSLTATDRWTSHLFADGFNGNLIAGYSGGKSGVSLDYVKNLLTIATPETIVWCLGMNNGDDGAVNPEWMSAYNELKSICANENITLILSTIPNAESTESIDGGPATTRIHDYKNAIVKASGYRYIDFAIAVGADENGEWYTGMKNPTDVHPTTKGATALYQRAICDAPEIMK